MISESKREENNLALTIFLLMNEYCLYSSSQMTLKIKLINKVRGRKRPHFLQNPKTTHVEYVIEPSAYCNGEINKIIPHYYHMSFL